MEVQYYILNSHIRYITYCSQIELHKQWLVFLKYYILFPIINNWTETRLDSPDLFKLLVQYLN